MDDDAVLLRGDPEAVPENEKFESAYERALTRWIAGDRRVVFPHGTWWMRVHHGARVARRPKPKPLPS